MVRLRERPAEPPAERPLGERHQALQLLESRLQMDWLSYQPEAPEAAEKATERRQETSLKRLGMVQGRVLRRLQVERCRRR